MKKVILTMCVAGALLATSCKKTKEEAKDLKETTVEAVKETTNATTEAATKVVKEVEAAVVGSGIEGVTIPDFKDPKVKEYLQSYSEYAKDYVAAQGDATKLTELSKKATDLATKGGAITGSLDAESAVKFSKVMTAIQSKMAPAVK